MIDEDTLKTLDQTSNTDQGEISLSRSPLRARVEKEKLGSEKPSAAKSKTYILDLKVKSPLSLMGPSGVAGVDAAPALVRLASVKGIDILGITDSHTARFVTPVQEAARNSDVTVLPGVELRCKVGICNEVIISCLFPEHCEASLIESLLTELQIPPEAGDDPSFIVARPLDEIITLVEDHDGLLFPSRIDKTPYRLSALPHLVEEHGFRAFDLAHNESVKLFRTKWPHLAFTLCSFSNANALAQLGSRYAKVKLEEPGFSGVRTLMRRECPIDGDDPLRTSEGTLVRA
jgi:hypothetical protein